jgi:gliding motility-associated-like protein
MKTAGKKQLFYLFFLILLFGSPLFSFSQYILNGSAKRDNCNCYTLTTETNFQSGSVWNSNKINLNQPFDFWFNIYLGCKDAGGADGMVFILQPNSTSIGTGAEGMGFEGVVPSVGISLDTWQNTNRSDPAEDHINIQINGIVTHGSDLAGPVAISPSNPNVEDCQWHVLRIAWDPATKWLRSWFDNNLRVQAQVDLIATVFNNDPMVYWGFTAGTGGANNFQKFCTALNPGFTTNLPNNITCTNQPVIFQNTSVSFGPIQSYYWDFGDNTTSTLQNPPPKNYPGPGVYKVKMVVTGLDGCISDTLKKDVVIGTKPIANFSAFDSCGWQVPRVIENSTSQVGIINNWTWLINNSVSSNVQQPQFTGLGPGNYEIKLVTKSEYGCESDTVSRFITMKPIPVISANTTDGCMNTPVQFIATQVDNITTLTQWNWNFGDNRTSTQQNPAHAYASSGPFSVNTWAIDVNGCSSDTIINNINIVFAQANAGNDTVVVKDVPLQLQGNGGASYSWSPSTALSNPAISNPTALPQDDITYILTITTPEGCEAADDIHVTVFKGSAIYVPTGFTPNNDGLNDLLIPKYVGIRRLTYFAVFNRWGQEVFRTNNMGKGWDGRIKGIEQATGTFAWIIKAEDFVGKIYQIKGTVTVIK